VWEFAGPDLVGDFWGVGAVVEGPDSFADGLVGGGHAFAGAKVVEPAFHDEGFVEVLGVGGVSVDAPADCAAAEADAFEGMDDVGELGVVLDGDAVVDGDADGAVVGVGISGEVGDGALPLVGCEVRKFAFEDMDA